MPHKFYIEYFEPKHLQKANKMMDRHLHEVEKDRLHCKEEIKEVLKAPTFWEKLKHKLKFI